jgi:DNA-binding response OmpR family regulator
MYSEPAQGSQALQIGHWPPRVQSFDGVNIQSQPTCQLFWRQPQLLARVSYFHANGDLAARIRSKQSQAGIILLTAQTALDTRLQGYKSGADVYLPKPVDFEELVAVLSSMARKIAANRSVEQPILRLDSQANKLSGPEGVAVLTEAEKRALTRFVLAPHSFLERWELMEAFGSTEMPVTPRSLEVRTATLRKKISDVTGSETNPIVGIRGTGYRLSIAVELV